MKTDTASASRKLTMGDILDHRAYERIRESRQKKSLKSSVVVVLHSAR